jgi:major membrane immunogen (membrane-anchored lipoprotein)
MKGGIVMNRKNSVIAILIFCMLISFAVSGCQKDEVKNLEDGVYFIQQNDFSETGWKDTVTILVEGGKITTVDWNGANKDGGTDKKTRSADGLYGMVLQGKAQTEWYIQAQYAEQYLVDEQDPKNIKYSDNKGHTDAITGVTISVSALFDLAEEALAKGPVGYGKYVDGTYHAQSAEFSAEGWKERVDATVISGYIVAVNWDPVNKEGETKKTLSQNGTYGMVSQGGAKSEWYVQAKLVEDDIVKNQDLTIYKAINDNGNIDSVAGVSISVIPAVDLLKNVIVLRDVIS